MKQNLSTKEKRMKLNLGCGSQTPHGWCNVDYAPGARLMKLPLFRALNNRIHLFNLDWNENIYLHNLTKRFPWDDGSIDIIYSSHTLEHFTKVDGRRFLSECHRVLKQDGIIRIVVPDLHYEVIEYLDGRVKADDFIERLGVLYGGSSNKFKQKLAPFYQFPHKCMYDNDRLIEILDTMGIDALVKPAFDSDIEDITLVELEGRTKNAVIIEGRKR